MSKKNTQHPYITEVAKSKADLAILHVETSRRIFVNLVTAEYQRAREASIGCDDLKLVVEAGFPIPKALYEAADDEEAARPVIVEHLAFAVRPLAELSVRAADAWMVAMGFAVLEKPKPGRRRPKHPEVDDGESE